jgi:hypothetical protein
MRYEEKNAQSSALMFREIPKERLDEDLKEIALLRAGYLNNSLTMTQFMLVSGKDGDPVKVERILRYSNRVVGVNLGALLSDPKMFAAIKRVLEGGPVPEIQGIDKSIWPSKKVWAVSFLSIQFVIFFVYSLAAFGGYQEPERNYNPLFGLPKGIGSKLALLTTVPGSIPLMFLILLFSAPSRIKARVGQGPAKEKRFSGLGAPGFSSQSSRESLARLSKGRQGR